MLRRIFMMCAWMTLTAGMTFAQWGTPQNLGGTVNTSANDFRPFISWDGNTLYLTSDRAGGYGNYDIWMSTQSGGTWQSPTNLGSPINTSYRDYLACVSSDGNTMYFISDRPGGQGLDIWVSRKTGGSWGTPTNLGATVNSSATE